MQENKQLRTVGPQGRGAIGAYAPPQRTGKRVLLLERKLIPLQAQGACSWVFMGKLKRGAVEGLLGWIQSVDLQVFF